MIATMAHVGGAGKPSSAQAMVNNVYANAAAAAAAVTAAAASANIVSTPVSEELQELRQVLQSGLRCRQHAEEEYTLYCLQDKKICCVECVHRGNAHRKHNVIPIKSATNLLRDEN